jgi:hypothetical protein
MRKGGYTVRGVRNVLQMGGALQQQQQQQPPP